MKVKSILAVIVIIILSIIFFRQAKPVSDEVVFWTLQMNDFSSYMNKVIENFEGKILILK